jgi:pimeloyl-ACP methyl ester carboxylesterase
VPSPRIDRATIDDRRVDVLLPPAYASSGHRYPVLYILYGFGEWPDVWLASTDLAVFTDRLPENQQAIVVMPDAGLGGYAESRDGSPSWEAWHIGSLIPWVDGHYRTYGDRSHRAIAGESLGAFGALAYAARHPDVFVAALAMSPLVITEANGAHAYAAARAASLACGDPGFDPRPWWGELATSELWIRNSDASDVAVVCEPCASVSALPMAFPATPVTFRSINTSTRHWNPSPITGRTSSMLHLQRRPSDTKPHSEAAASTRTAISRSTSTSSGPR